MDNGTARHGVSACPMLVRDVIVLKSGDAVEILSMRDIVCCWLTEGAACDVTPQSPTA